ncbi:MAG: UDP-N-acetylmuramoyl-L-alanine--D-glutamate ligase, partial [Nitrospinaceae bacterium]|nr:UDP-N-acetylmuramoyl-L-alanine--D-glutamate ligase [Nitrospinaceae bacterium]NIR57877.1 UDP-N-acetylmuramoyl-L-alanine--D-glutamate ligase [Nitrospinaceae bacterium]NIS88336.1 UDP-N-acetylmuramoyl-L-alanine--D-glutamate ligase [Nitrospinaceae bacterium]NIT85214.1 UDP-N-acetylmuramoyl-L-alanine--D-glutamate ligase [Nitrospinaceae bacterium]NIU47364.1 UDP-N-acetylmuramoyl-L-alanine--D-glutamate ligase [Nitrospinaceae bacterium]
EGIQTFHPWMALVLNLTPDHMDRHKTMEHYAELKSRIAQNQTARDFLILNRDDPWTVGLGGSRNAHRVYFSRQTEVEEGAF